MKGMRRNVEMFRINKAGDGAAGRVTVNIPSRHGWDTGRGPVEDEED